MNIYMSLEDWTEENDKDELPMLYLSICQCAYNCNEYNMAIKYGYTCMTASVSMAQGDRSCWRYRKRT